ncbi:MAG: ribosome biogenesis GTPase Der [Chlorobi bacterium]|nr:ribosome biogenesis GTPase Der [Chlorobiota bacterium]
MNTVAIVGRPNVGKSTLFNRILERREAIVEERPGVTRDRLYGDAEWNGVHFHLVDTGGIVPDSDDVFERAIREQAAIAIAEADVIVFVVDASSGITPLDESVAAILRGAGKPVIVAVNKCDHPQHDAAIADAYRLGFDQVFGISAMSGRQTGDLLDAITSYLEPSQQPSTDERLKIAIVGRPNVGKSSIVNALLGEQRMVVTPIAGTTRDAVDSVLRYYGREIVLVDTAGLRRRSAIAESVELYSVIRTQRAIERCDVAVVVLDATRGLEHQDKQIIADVVAARKGIVIAVNKWDAVEKDSKTADLYAERIRSELPTADFAPIVFTSAVTKQRLVTLIEKAEEIQARRLQRIPTAQLNELLLPELERTPPPAVRGRDLRINYVTQTGVAPPLFVFFTNFPDLVPDHYKRFIERTLRRLVPLEGVPVSLLFRRK